MERLDQWMRRMLAGIRNPKQALAYREIILMEEIESVPDLYRLAYMPGVFRCPKCEFQLRKQTISTGSGEIGTSDTDRESEPCPNDGTMMVHVTYKEMLADYDKRLGEEFSRRDEWRKLLEAASHGLRSYQYGNSSPDLAEEMANKIDQELRRMV